MPPVMRAIVIANGEPPSLGLMQDVAMRSRLVVAADGGADRALEAGVQPHVVIGDLDSVSAAARRQLIGTQFLQDTDPDTTDLEKALNYCMSRGATEISVLCAGGGRADHALGNLSLLVKLGRTATIRFVDDQFAISLVDGRAEVDGPPGTVVSLVAIGECTGVTTRGMRWELTDYTMQFSPYGIHNEIAESPASVSVASGDLLLFAGRWVERHGRPAEA